MPWTFWIIALITLLFVAVLMTKAIMTPIKKRREAKRWQDAKSRWTQSVIHL